jgi:hypothetical protein
MRNKWKVITAGAISVLSLWATLPAQAQDYDRWRWRERERREEWRRDEWRREQWRRAHERREWLCWNRGICDGYYGGYYVPRPPVYRRPGFNFELNLPNN